MGLALLSETWPLMEPAHGRCSYAVGWWKVADQVVGDDLSNYAKRLAPCWAEAKNSKVFVQRGHAVNAKTAHHCKTGAIDDRKILVVPGTANVPGNLQVGLTNRLNDRYPTS